MKLWRKQAKKDPVTGKRNGRQIRYEGYISEQVLKYQPKSYPLLDALIQKSGITFVMSKKEQSKLEELIASANKETANETV
jgi:predicted transcriptional regulator